MGKMYQAVIESAYPLNLYKVLVGEDADCNNCVPAELENAVNSLDPNESQIIKLRFGAYDGKFKRTDRIADLLNIPEQTIHEIAANAMLNLGKKYSMQDEHIRKAHTVPAKV